jgi:hypothetical protein
VAVASSDGSDRRDGDRDNPRPDNIRPPVVGTEQHPVGVEIAFEVV